MSARILTSTHLPVVDIILDTLKKKKQAIVFVNTKRSAEKEAEEIAKQLSAMRNMSSFAEDARNALPKPTEQCERLAKCLLHGVAFHHAGLHSAQRDIVEECFRVGKVKVICATPTLAAGVDLPAFRAVIRDLKRFSGRGLSWIPVLEYLQMAGRAGRPKYDSFGEAIVVCSTDTECEAVMGKYVRGSPEPVFSKLAVEPVLRTYLLSLTASGIIYSVDSAHEFFSKTFWAHQYGDLKRLGRIIEYQLQLLEDWNFVELSDNKLKATLLGERVAQVYLDPLTAHEFVCAIENHPKNASCFALLHLVCNTLELRPLLAVRQKDYECVEAHLASESLLQQEPEMGAEEYDDWLKAGKTAMMLESWMEEKDDQFLLENFDVRPGESRTKLDLADWLLYALVEIAKLRKAFGFVKEVQKARLRLKYGVHEELLPLIRLEGIGRVRARKLFKNGIKDIADIKNKSFAVLRDIVGAQVAKNLKKQVGDDVPDIIPENKRKGQLGLMGFDGQ